MNKNIQRLSRFKHSKQEDYESALQITYKIVHYIHNFSTFKINRMIVEFMQDEYKNLWLLNCSYISYEKIEGMTEIEAINLKRMSRFNYNFNFESRRKRSKTLPFKNLQKDSESKSQILRGSTNEMIEKKHRKMKFENMSQSLRKETSLSPAVRKNRKNLIFMNEIQSSSSILNNKKVSFNHNSKENNKKIVQTLEINRMRSKQYQIIKPNGIKRRKNCSEKPKKTYRMKNERVKTTRLFSLNAKGSQSLYYHGNLIKDKNNFDKLKDKVFSEINRDKKSLTYLVYSNRLI